MDHSKISVIHTSEPKIPGYSIVEKIGEGGMAKVYLATQESLDRTVALKILSPSLTARDPTISARFLKEGKIVAKLNHPNIVTVFDIGKASSLYYMAMEYISGGNLKEHLENQITIRDPLDIIRQMAKALGYAHQHDVIHRDVKPANILFREDSSVVLSDFGIAKTLTSHTSLTMTGFIAGTPHYMSPEQARGDPADSRSDLYSLGVVFYEILTREKPFDAEDPFATVMCHITSPIPSLPEQFSFYQPIINRLMAKDPDDRYISAERLIKALDRAKTVSRYGDEESEIAPGMSESVAEKTRIQKPERRLFSGGIEGADRETRIQKARRITGRKKQFHLLHLARSWQWSLLAVLLIAVVIGGYMQFSSPHIDPQTRWIINMMLEKASRQLEASRLTEPVSDNAYKTYREVLEIIPNNKDALHGMQLIAGRLEQQAIDKQKQGDYEESLAVIVKGLEIAPDNKDLLKHKLEITGLLQDRKLQEKISGLLLQAESYIKDSQYTEPSDANAHQVYQVILGLDPGNKDALNGMESISGHYANQAVIKQQEGRLKEALNLAIKGLQIDPDNRGLVELKDKITGNIKVAELQVTITELHSLAEQQLSDSKHIVPPGDNAYETYQKILLLDSEDTRALEGIGEVKINVTAEIENRKLSGDHEQALALVDRSLQLQPDDKEMLGVKKNINNMLEERQRLEIIQKLEHIARQQMMESNLLSPSEDNAYETYQELLALDPENNNAREGLDGIASKVIELAQSDLRNGLLKDSIEKLDMGLDYYPNNTEFLDMREEVAALLEKKLVKQQIDKLTRLAKKQLAASRYTSPANDNAYTTLRNLETLDPGNSEAATGLKLIADHFTSNAQQAVKDGRSSDALTVINQGLKAFPGNEEMVNIRNSISSEVEENKRRQQEVRELVLKANSQVMQSRYVRPDGDNALETYRRILAIDPGNGKALSGLEEMARNIEQSALHKQKAGDLEQSLALINDGLKISPKHSGLLQLRDKVSFQQNNIKQRDKVKGLLAMASKQMDAARLTQPKGDNAYETYQQVLDIDPGNSQAKEEMLDIPKRYAQLIRQSQAQGAYPYGLSMVEEGLQTFPGNSVFEELKRELEELIAANKQDQVVADLLAKAQKQVAALHLTSPKGDNAYESYRQVMEIDPANIAAKNGIDDIADRYAKLALRHQARGDMSKSLVMVEKGLNINPDHKVLMKLKDQMLQTQKSADNRRQKLDALLRKAENQFISLRLVEPVGDNAHETYLKILGIDPGNEEARRGLGSIAQRFERIARTKQKEGDLSGGLHDVNKGLDVVPNNKRLLALRAELEHSLENRQRRETEIRKIEELLIQANQKLASGQLTQPTGSSALAIYREIQKMDPGNVGAREGIEEIAKSFERRARTKQKNGELEDSLLIVNEGLKHIPGSANLLSLQSELMREIATQQELEKDRKDRAPIFGTF